MELPRFAKANVVTDGLQTQLISAEMVTAVIQVKRSTAVPPLLLLLIVTGLVRQRFVTVVAASLVMKLS